MKTYVNKLFSNIHTFEGPASSFHSAIFVIGHLLKLQFQRRSCCKRLQGTIWE